MNDRAKKRNSIVSHIIDGSVTIDSVKDFENLLKAFPDDPWLHRFFADLLEREKSFYAAADAYGIAAELFIEADMIMQAIVSKILEWQILGLSYQEGQDFYSSLRETGSKNTGMQQFFIKMTYPELIAFMSMLVIRYFPEGGMMKKFGDEENNLYFVVSGTLEKTIYHRLEKVGKVQKKSSKNLMENDFFGEIYPFEEEKVSQTDIKTITRIELAEISKSMLTKICRQNPDVEPLVDCLYLARLKSDEKKFTKIVRKTVRHQVPTQVNLKVFQDHGDKAPLELSGFTNDISLGGASVVLGAMYKVGHSFNLIGRNVKIQMCLPIESIVINMLGTIVWGKDVPLEGKTTAIVGIQFKEMTDIDRGLLKEYCYGSEGEQNLIWSLWDSLLEK